MVSATYAQRGPRCLARGNRRARRSLSRASCPAITGCRCRPRLSARRHQHPQTSWLVKSGVERSPLRSFRLNKRSSNLARHTIQLQFVFEDLLQVNIEDFRVQLTEETHIHFIHFKGYVKAGPDGMWNDTWSIFFNDKGSDLSAYGIFNQLAGMLNQAGVQYYTPMYLSPPVASW